MGLEKFAMNSNEDLSFDNSEFLSSLNEAQRAAVLNTDGALLVLAGAGTGKTKVLTSRIVHIVNSNIANANSILAVTFTNKAANEMKSRIQSMLLEKAEGLWIGTFHSICVKILRRHAEAIGYIPHFTIIDYDDQIRLIKQLLKAENIDEKQINAKYILSQINRYKDKAKLPKDVVQKDVISHIYQHYQERLKILNAMDFGDLILNCINLFKQNEQIAQLYQEQFKYILVDEYQDTNLSQYMWLKILSDHYKNLCCVGDDDQSIYGWRGAEIENILKFEQDFEKAKVIKLEQNYRSTKYILSAASDLISNNKERLGKTLWTSKNEGEKLTIRGTWDNQDEARFVVDEIEQARREGINLNEIAILVRASYQTRDFEERCLKTGTPYKVIGGLRFYERQEIKDALAYIRFLIQPDDGLAFERIINVPKRGIGDSSLKKMHLIANEENVSLPKACYNYVFSSSKNTQANQSMKEFFLNFERWREMLSYQSHVDIVKSMLDESGYTGMWMAENSIEAAARLENLKELVKAIEEFESLEDFIDHVGLVNDNKTQYDEESVSLMTMHAAKGLEFDYVFLPAWEEGIFPNAKAIQENGTSGLEEERRLGYVGISRAKKKATISYAMQRRMPHQGWQMSSSSRFLKELSSENVEHFKANGKIAEFNSYKQNNYKNADNFINYKKLGFSDYKKNKFFAGDKVFHNKFGYGVVREVEGEHANVEFDLTDIKTIHTSYLSK